MEPTKHQGLFEFKLTAIELLEFSLNFNEKLLPDLKLFHYNINLEHRIVEESKLVIVIMRVSVMHEDQETTLASVKASCIFEIANIEDILQKQGNSISLPEAASMVVNSITISTLRGIMFSLFRGTYLHNAILPVIEPQKLTANPL
jgi:hypothetical protein